MSFHSSTASFQPPMPRLEGQQTAFGTCSDKDEITFIAAGKFTKHAATVALAAPPIPVQRISATNTESEITAKQHLRKMESQFDCISKVNIGSTLNLTNDCNKL